MSNRKAVILQSPVKDQQAKMKEIITDDKDKKDDDESISESIAKIKLADINPEANADRAHKRLLIDQTIVESHFNFLKQISQEKPKPFASDIIPMHNYDESITFLAKSDLDGTPNSKQYVFIPKSVIDDICPTFFDEYCQPDQNLINT